MDKININNLFNQNNSNKEQILGINNLFQDNSRKNDIFNINDLLNKKEERKKKVLDIYKKKLKDSLKRINTANKYNLTSITYEVPYISFNCKEYNPIECINYIYQRLEKICMDTIILSDNSIYISWENIDDNIKNNNTSS